MQITPDRSLAEEWLPSRFNLAIFRLLGLMVATRVQHRPSSASMLYHDREQHPLEAYVMSCALLSVPAIHFFVALLPRLRWPWLTGSLVIVALPFVSIFAWDLVVFSVALAALLLRAVTGVKIDAIRMQSPIIHMLMVALSLSSIVLEWRTAWLGIAWLALVALNALCAIALRAGRERVSIFAREVSQTT